MTITTALRGIRMRTPVGPLRGPFAAIRDVIAGALFPRDLETLSLIHSTDKNVDHRYAQHYARHFASWRKRRLTLLEIGIGGYDDPNLGGGSLRMWRTYFPRGQIYGIDIHDKSVHDGRRIKTFQGSQFDPRFLDRVLEITGPPDIIIDDGSHVSRDVIVSFGYLFPRMANDGIYVVEDLQTSYWDDWGGDDENPESRSTAVGFFGGLIHGMHYEERPSRHLTQASYFEQNILGLSFYHNLVFVQKGPNVEGGRYREAGAI